MRGTSDDNDSKQRMTRLNNTCAYKLSYQAEEKGNGYYQLSLCRP